ncbi:hypothetical protein LTR36_003298 [Oleoguttula mirabilis]|uniref:FAT domain-containing protein n=1 Tax=Oleoguttula mirabilis TaxID=1507867 RepID=A0AAV9JZ39_9PEZI|nr:hypothetical protein LTR36_003298 [Oleoguttula mirabilis]
MNEEQRINVCKTSVAQIYTMLRSSPQQWRAYLVLARSVTAHLDATSFMQQTSRTTEQNWIITALQRLAFADPDNGAVQDIAAWCARQWQVILQRVTHNVAALRGMGEAWLSRAQPALSRIHHVDGSSSSGGSSQWSAPSITSSDDERQNSAATTEAERRSGTADYVEARGFLQPAVEYLERAVTAAPAQQALSGDLLVKTAEAYMSLGNASSPRVNERYFRRALQLLRAAKSIPGYTLWPYLERYLDDYGRLLE